TYQTVSVPRTRPVEPQLPTQQPPATVTQVRVSQSTPGVPTQPTLPPATEMRATQSAGVPLMVPEVDELSRIEAGFNLDPIRIEQINSPLLTPTQPPARQREAQVQQLLALAQQRPLSSEQTYLGPFGMPLRQYGYSMFAGNVSTFAPVDDIPVGPDYALGPEAHTTTH